MTGDGIEVVANTETSSAALPVCLPLWLLKLWSVAPSGPFLTAEPCSSSVGGSAGRLVGAGRLPRCQLLSRTTKGLDLFFSQVGTPEGNDLYLLQTSFLCTSYDQLPFKEFLKRHIIFLARYFGTLYGTLIVVRT